MPCLICTCYILLYVIQLRLWVHEVMREFHDRLIDDKDREWFFNEVRSNVNKNLQESFDVVFNNLSDSSVCNCTHL